MDNDTTATEGDGATLDAADLAKVGATAITAACGGRHVAVLVLTHDVARGQNGVVANIPTHLAMAMLQAALVYLQLEDVASEGDDEETPES